MRLVVVASVVAICVGVARASTLDLILGTPAPAGTVVLSGSALPSPYQGGVNAYDGVLNWTDQANSAVHYSTYCIDVASVISVNNPYQFDLVNLSTITLYDPKVVNAIENLWAQHPVEGNVGLALGPNIYASNAATFQTAIWDIIENHYDKSGNPIATPSLSFSQPGNGFTNADLSNAMDWSAAAYAAGVYSGPDNFAALISTDGGQSQAMFMINLGPQIIAAPAPSSLAGGASLLAALALMRRALRRRMD